MNTLRLIVLCVLAAVNLDVGAADDAETSLEGRLHSAEKTYRTEGPATALPDFQRLLGMAIDSDDRNAEATVRRFIGECHWRMGEFDEADEELGRALVIARDIGDPELEAKTLNVLGLLAWDLGELDTAIERFEAASAIGAELSDPKIEGATLNNISLVYDELGDYRRSLEQYRQVLDIYAGTDFARGTGDTLGNIGGVYLLLGRYSEAEEYYRRAYELSESQGWVPAMSQDLGNLGFVYTGLGRTGKAIEHFDRAIELAEQAGMAQEKGFWLRGKANAELLAGRYDQGLAHHREALRIFQETGAEILYLDGLHDMGQLMLELGDPISAQRYFNQAMTLAESAGRASTITQSRIALGDLKMRQRQWPQAESLYTQARDTARDNGETDLEASAQLRLGALALERGQHQTAADHAGAAHAIGVEQKNPLVATDAMLLEAESLRKRGEWEAALARFGEAAGRADAIDDPDRQWQAGFGLGQVLEAQGRPEAAVEAYAGAVEHIESVRNRLRQKRYRAGYLQDKHQVYTRLARLQLELGRPDDAFSTAERLRSFSYSEQADRPARVSVESTRLAELRARIRQLQTAIDEERSWPAAEQRQLAIDTFSAELLLAQQEYQGLLDDRVAAGVTAPVETRPESIRRHLGADEALIEFVVGVDHVLVFVLSREDMHTAVTPLARRNLHARVELLRDLLTERDHQRWSLPAAGLAESLLEPAIAPGWLDSVEHLYLVPHDALNYLPFAILSTEGPDGHQALVERFTLSYLPSASSLLARMEPSPDADSMLAVVPERAWLSHAPEEITAVAGLFEPNVRALRGPAATETAFRELAGDYGLLHLATHGYFNKLNPLLSGLELEADEANDGLLEVHEILGLRLRADLVTLSACKTGLGSGFFAEIPAGDDFVGLTRAFLEAGSFSVLATLWEVDDRSTVDLMKDFYTNLEAPGAGRDKAVALARAQRALRASDDFRHPYYWAPFILVGASAAPLRLSQS